MHVKKRISKQARQRDHRPRTLANTTFRELVEHDAQLKSLRNQYAGATPEERHKAAQWAQDSAHAEMLLAQATNDRSRAHPAWHDAAAPLAIDPDYAPAMLTVSSLEYQYGRIEEAMELFLKLTALPAETEDLTEIIDTAGDFLIDQDDEVNAARLYGAAVHAFPRVAVYHVGLGFCAAQAGRMTESVAHHRHAVELEPENYLHLNDLGYSLLQSGQLDEAEVVLKRAAQLAPPDYELARGNLEHLQKLRGER
jgi:tetratricopeptide (TPR) repeat protein